MARSIAPLLPDALDRLAQLGERLRLARRRRKLSAALVAERAGMSRVTLGAVEKGLPGVTIGAYLAVMQVLGLDAGLARMAQEDPLGRELQDAALQPKRHRGNAPSLPRAGAAPGRSARHPPATPTAQTSSPRPVPSVPAPAKSGLGLADTLREQAKARAKALTKAQAKANAKMPGQ
jgi:transcriptional regulator with XRE-family HTH domain